MWVRPGVPAPPLVGFRRSGVMAPKQLATSAATKRGGADAGEGDAKRLKTPDCPKLPPDTQRDIGSRAVMKSVAPWVVDTLNARLPGMLHLKNFDVRCAEPLVIAGAQGLQSFKEAWVPKNALASCRSVGMYEAGGNLLWIDPEVAVGSTEIPSEDPAWHAVCRMAQALSEPTVFENGKKRIRLTVTLSCARRAGLVGMSGESYPSGGALVLLGGHGVLWSWYVAMAQALKNGETDLVKMLYECALTTTLCMWTTTESRVLALESIRLSENIRTVGLLSVDNFIVFAKKIWYMSPAPDKPDLKKLIHQDVRFHGAIVNTTMMRVILSLKPFLTSQVEDLLNTLDREFGMEVLTASYNKIKLLMQAVKNNTEVGSWVLASMIVSLRRQEVAPSDFTVECYSKGKSQPSFIQIACANKVIVRHCASLVDTVAEIIDAPLAAKLKAVVDDLAHPFKFHEKFPIAGVAKDDGDDEEKEDEAPDSESKPDYLQKLQDSSSPAAVVLFAELLHKVYQGTYDEDVRLLAEVQSPEQLLSAQTDLKQLGTDLKELATSLSASENVMGIGASTKAPKPSLRELVRRSSESNDPEAAAVERQDLWKRAVAQRKKMAVLHKVENKKKKESYTEIFEKFPASVKDFEGKTGLEHRVFVLSCDLMNQKGPTPWLTASPPDDAVLDSVLEFMKETACKSNDVIMVWDGCQRKSRRTLEDSIGSMPAAAEVFVTYTSSWNAWVKKKYVLGSENKECGYIRFPQTRTKQGVKKRSSGNAAGEATSHWTTITGLVPPHRLNLPRVSPADKLKIFPEQPAASPTKWTKCVPSGVPMFWGETKSIATWDLLLNEVCAKVVVDLSPGSGSLASACLSQCLVYHGIVGHASHMGWLTNVMDRESLQYISRMGHPLYQEDLATHLMELFGEIVESEVKANDDEICITDSEEES